MERFSPIQVCLSRMCLTGHCQKYSLCFPSATKSLPSALAKNVAGSPYHFARTRFGLMAWYSIPLMGGFPHFSALPDGTRMIWAGWIYPHLSHPHAVSSQPILGRLCGVSRISPSAPNFPFGKKGVTRSSTDQAFKGSSRK